MITKHSLAFEEHMYYVYCLENQTSDYKYIGSTRNLKRRLYQHTAGKSASTKPHLPLELTASIAVNTEAKARKLERYFKTGSGRAILEKRILQK